MQLVSSETSAATNKLMDPGSREISVLSFPLLSFVSWPNVRLKAGVRRPKRARSVKVWRD